MIKLTIDGRPLEVEPGTNVLEAAARLGIEIPHYCYHPDIGIDGNCRMCLVQVGANTRKLAIGCQLPVSEGMDVPCMKKVNSSLGSAGIIVLDETTDMPDAVLNLMKFYAHESCGQCTPCREGTPWVVKVLDRICSGEGRSADMDLLLDIADNMEGRTVCALADGACWPLVSIVQKFRHEFEAKIKVAPRAAATAAGVA